MFVPQRIPSPYARQKRRRTIWWRIKFAAFFVVATVIVLTTLDT